MRSRREEPEQPGQQAGGSEAVNGFFRGREQLVSGWLLDLKDSARKHEVEVFLGGKRIGTAKADRFDPLVQAQHGGDGKYAFALYYAGQLHSGPVEATVVDKETGWTLRTKQPMVTPCGRSGPPLTIDKLAIGANVELIGRIGAYSLKEASIEFWCGDERVVSAIPVEIINDTDGVFSARLSGDALRCLFSEPVSVALPGLKEAGLAVPAWAKPLNAAVSEQGGKLHVQLSGSFEQTAPIPLTVRFTAPDGTIFEETGTAVSKSAVIAPREGRNLSDDKVEVLLAGVSLPTRVEWRLLNNAQFRDPEAEDFCWSVSEGARIERGFFAFPQPLADQHGLSGHIAHVSAGSEASELRLSQRITELPATGQRISLTALVRAPKKAKLTVRLRDDQGVLCDYSASSRNGDSWTILTLQSERIHDATGEVTFEVEASGRNVHEFDVAIGHSRELETVEVATTGSNLLVNAGMTEWPYGAGTLHHEVRGAACTGWRVFNRKSRTHTLTRAVMDSSDGSLGLAVAAAEVPNYLRIEADFTQAELAGRPLTLSFRAGIPPSARQMLKQDTGAVSKFAVVDRIFVIRRRRLTAVDRFEEKDSVAAVFARKVPIGWDIERFSFDIPPFEESDVEEPGEGETLEETYHLAFDFRHTTVVALFDVEVLAGDGVNKSNTLPRLTVEDRNIEMQIEMLETAAHWRGPTPVRLATAKSSNVRAPLKWSATSSREPVEIVIPVFNALDETLNCLESLKDSTTVPLLVRLIDDGSDKPVGQALEDYIRDKPWIQLHSFGSNRGYTYASDFGIRQGATTWVVLLNSDTVVTRGWLEGMLACARSDAAIGFVGPLSNAASYQSVPELYDASKKWKVNRLPPGVSADDMAEIVRRVSLKAYPRVPLLNGFCTMMKRSLFIELGGLNAAAFPTGYGEENDLCLRARKAGIELAVADDVYVYHVKSASFGSARRTELTKSGNAALKLLHPDVDISALTAKFRETPALVAVRDGVARELTKLHAPAGHSDAASKTAGTVEEKTAEVRQAQLQKA